jgi:hypothetical protein
MKHFKKEEVARRDREEKWQAEQRAAAEAAKAQQAAATKLAARLANQRAIAAPRPTQPSTAPKMGSLMGTSS